MPEAYPTGVPHLMEKGSYSIAPYDSVLKIEVDIGKAMSRNKFTGQSYLIKFRIKMSESELDLFLVWYNDILKKVLEFYFYDELEGVNKTYRFLNQPSYNHIGVDRYIVNFDVKSILAVL